MNTASHRRYLWCAGRPSPGRTISRYLATSHSPHASFLNFQQLTNCPSFFAHRQLAYFQHVPNCLLCNLFVLITMQIAGGGCAPPCARVKVLLEVSPSPPPRLHSCTYHLLWCPGFSGSFPILDCEPSTADPPKSFRMRSSAI